MYNSSPYATAISVMLLSRTILFIFVVASASLISPAAAIIDLEDDLAPDPAAVTIG